MSEPDLAGAVDAMDDTWSSILTLAGELGPEEFALATRCPGWDVHDQLAHIASLERLLAGGELPPEAPEAAHVRNPVGARMERGVHALRGLPPDALVAELTEAIEARRAALREHPPRPGDQVPGAMGNPVPVEQSLPIRVLDLWAHEQDVRAATGRPGNTSGPGARLSQETILGMLPMFWVKQAGAGPGQSLRIVVTGDLPADRTVVVGADGRASFVEQPEDAEPVVTLELDWLDLVARSHGRVGGDRTPVAVTGDDRLAQGLLGAWPMSP